MKKSGKGKMGIRQIAVSTVLIISLMFCGCMGKKAGSSGVSQEESFKEESVFAESRETEEKENTSVETESEETGADVFLSGNESESETSASAAESAADKAVIQQKVVIATDIHYLAEELAGNRCESFMSYVESGDGRVLQYSWEILDAFLQDMIKEKPDLVVLSGDLTLNGEKKSHEELAKKLYLLTEHDIQVAVIPGNHDINNREARKFSEDGAVKTDSVTAGEFAQIYADFGYVAADDRDPASLSYLYKLDNYYWILMLDSCQYEPENQIGGMIRRETYEWMEKHLSDAWEKGAQVITVSHHNLLEQSDVSREFTDNCTIEHNEELIQMLYDWQVRLHFSGHLHLQHYMQDEDSEIYEVVTGSLVMSPCHYGVLEIMNSGDYVYNAKAADVDGWAKKKGYKNRDLADFKTFCETFLTRVTYKNAVLDLRKHTSGRTLFLSDEKIDKMARYYAKLCVYYYEGRMFEIWDSVRAMEEYGYWTEIEYASELSDFLKNILNDEAKDFSRLMISY